MGIIFPQMVHIPETECPGIGIERVIPVAFWKREKCNNSMNFTNIKRKITISIAYLVHANEILGDLSMVILHIRNIKPF